MHNLNVRILGPSSFISTLFQLKKYLKFNPTPDDLNDNTNIILFHTDALQDKIQKDYIDNNFDMIMIDETQDFDLIMLNILINDTSIPKIFVGDPKQSIYQFRGCINAFNFLPTNSFIIEFYSTFRVGNPSCQIISNKYKIDFFYCKIS